MSDVDFFWDPVCPWAWITSRWVVEVQQQRRYTVRWRPISLMMINAHRTDDWYTPQYRAGHRAGTECLRVADAVDRAEGNDAVGRLYTEIGTRFHNQGRRDEYLTDREAFLAEVLAAAGLDGAYAAHADDTAHDPHLRAETDLAFARAGNDVGTPIITFGPDTPGEASFFGPVIARIPRGDDALRLWDAVEVIATTSGMAELKRSNRSRPMFD